MTAPDLSRFFEPERIIVVTATPENDPEAPGIEFPEAGIEFTTVDSLREDPPGTEALVVPVLPPEERQSLLEELKRTQARAVLLPGSLPEDPVAARTEPGPDDEWADIRRVLEGADYRVLGPEATIRVSAASPSAGASTARAGRMAILAARPAIAECLRERATERGAAVDLVVGVGGGIDVEFGDVAAWAAEQEKTNLVLGRSGVLGSSFVETIRAADSETSIAITGEYGPSIPAVSERTIAGRTVTNTIIEQAGAVAVDSLEGILQSAPALAGQPAPDPESVVVVSNAGGPGVMGIDAVGTSGLDVARLDSGTIERVEEAIPEHGSAQNPLDLVADSDVGVFETVLAAVLEDPNVGAAVVMSAPNPLVDFRDLAEVVVGASHRYSAPLVTVLMGGERTEKPAEILQRAGIPNYFDPYRAVVALDLLRQQEAVLPNRRRDFDPPDSLGWDNLEAAVTRKDPDLEGTPARDFVSNLGGDVREERPDTGLEVVIEGYRCPERGPQVVTGIAEFAGAVGDLSVRAAPLVEADAADMLQELQGAPVFEGARGREPVAVRPLEDTLRGLSHFIAATDTVERISLPGAMATEAGIWAPKVTFTRDE